ncbi:MAG: hypothetical protein M3O71_15605 [Bacteroidota bacterium]|nr:hypothetical protein [Bacteroidota bacterium]
MSATETFFKKIGFEVKPCYVDVHLGDAWIIEAGGGASSQVLKCRAAEGWSAFWESHEKQVRAVLLNGARFDPETIYDLPAMNQFVTAHYPNFSPEEKMDRLLYHIHQQSTFEGEIVDLKLTDRDIHALYFTNRNELDFYIDSGARQDLILASASRGITSAALTISGLTRLARSRTSEESSYGFVAMAYTPAMFELYEQAFSPAISAAGFIPYIMSKEDVPSDQTINDAMLAGIKQSRFMIADFSTQGTNIYFEAGYALGRGLPVIYCCHQDKEDRNAFDTRNYQHLLYRDATDLYQQLLDKITVFVKA